MCKKCFLDKFVNRKKAKSSIDEQTAQEKYNDYKCDDPYPEIAPALLNPYDVQRYISKTGMIYPFNPEQLKTATYAVPFNGDVHYWDGDEKKVSKLYDDCDYFEIKPNSIVYIHISTVFRVPYYMVFRFNLTINLVHRGLLLGTGPVVDPGFQGRLLIPIHNLTSNTYCLKANDNFIWVEFTKMSPLHFDDKKYSKYDKLNMLDNSANEYFFKANSMGKIVSSIPEAMQEANKKSDEALRNTKRLQVSGALTALISSIAILYGGYQLITSVVMPTISLVSDYKEEQHIHNKEIKILKEKLLVLENKITTTNKNSNVKSPNIVVPD